jgi:hypothetical protein
MTTIVIAEEQSTAPASAAATGVILVLHVSSPTSGLAAAEARQLRQARVWLVRAAPETGANSRMPTPAMAKVWLGMTGHVTAIITMVARTAKLTHLIVMVAANLKTFLNRPALVNRILKALPVRHLLVRIASTQIAKHAEGME